MDLREKIKIVQHNTQYWTPNKINLTNTYLQVNPDIILLNSYGVKNDNIYIKGYKTYQKNTTGQLHDG